MQSRYNEADAKAAIAKYPGVSAEIALRVYTSRLIGADDTLVMHGGGNTSVKGVHKGLLGENIEAIYVKGSGWNLDTIEPPGFPGMDLTYLRKLRALPKLSDEQMVNEQRSHMFDSNGPNPSVETLLHAFLPHKVVDHSHADAILALTNRPDGEALVREIFGARVGIVPYVMPGFALAKLCAEVYERDPKVEGLVLLKHGLFTFGETAKESYERHTTLVHRAEEWLAAKSRNSRSEPAAVSPDSGALAARIAPLLRGLLAEATGNADAPHRRMVLDWRATPAIMDFVNRPDLRTLALTGPLTPDHVIRTKAMPCVMQQPAADDAVLREQLVEEITAFRKAYNDYFDEQTEAKGVTRTRLDDFPRVVLVPGAGMFCFGPSKKDARIAADIYEHTIAVKALVAATGKYEGLPMGDLFDVEYWPLEQAKLGKSKEKSLARQVALVTGAAGAIGSAVAERLIEEGAHVVLTDINAEALTRTCDDIGKKLGKDNRRGVVGDITDEKFVRELFDEISRQYGGVDIVVPNAGIAHSASFDTLDVTAWERVQRVNSSGYFLVMRESIKHMRRQGTGGHIVVVGSKNVAAPGAEFAAYSASKAAAHQMAKVAALETAKDGIRVNVLAPDAVFGNEHNPSGLWQEVGPGRAKAHGVEANSLEDFYRQRNLLKARVTGRHVGNAVVFFASNQTPTTGATLPIDGGIGAAFSR
ncbi:MAG: bifunctional aldolase/short-chain dehydrogenase [Planctomycetes bacterium]|nr:bifunctional aldolase/short-chain dehydrogenase [Planctomycetota bacterium]